MKTTLHRRRSLARKKLVEIFLKITFFFFSQKFFLSFFSISIPLTKSKDFHRRLIFYLFLSLFFPLYFHSFFFHQLWSKTVKNPDVGTGPLHSLVRSLVFSHRRRTLFCLLRPAHFARVLRCAHSFACLLTHSLQSSWKRI